MKLFWVALMMPVLLQAQHNADSSTAALESVQSKLVAILNGKSLGLRDPRSAKEIHCDARTTCDAPGEPVPLANGGILEIKSVKVSSDVLTITGDRVLVVLYPGARIPLGYPVLISCRLDPSLPLEPQINAHLGHVFLFGSELDERLRNYWKQAFGSSKKDKEKRRLNGLPAGTLWDGRSAYYVQKGTISPPKPTYAPDPAYDEVAREQHRTGTVTLSIVVNEHGLPEVIEVVKSADPRLDWPSARAVSQWRFEPAQRNGQPVPVLITVEVNFRLY